MRITVRLSMATVAMAAALLSYQSLVHLGVICGYGNLSWLFPIVVDAGASACCAAWLHGRGRQPLAMTWALLAVSVVLNGTTHYLESTHTAPSRLLVVAVAAVPPTVLGLCVHLAVGMGRPGQLDPGGAELAESNAPQVGASPQLLDVSQVTDLAHGANSAYEVPELVAKDIDMGRPGSERVGARTESGPTSNVSSGADAIARLISDGVGPRRLAAELDFSEHQARQLLAASKNGDGR